MWSPHKPGEGSPIFAKPHMVRQRRSVAEMRCTVCGEKTPTCDRWWFELGVPMQGWAMVTTEAPVHYACAKLSLKVCPHLRAGGNEPVPWYPPDAILRAIVGGAAIENDFNINLHGKAVVGHLKFAWRHAPVRMRPEYA
jgi:hypothetical protein